MLSYPLYAPGKMEKEEKQHLTQPQGSRKASWRRGHLRRSWKGKYALPYEVGRALSIQRGTEKTQEEQGQKPGECYHFRAGLRTWGLQRGHRIRKQRHGELRRRAFQGSWYNWMPVKPGEGQRPRLG